MPRPHFRLPSATLGVVALSLLSIVACSSDRGSDPASVGAQELSSGIPTGVDTSKSVVQRGPRVDIARAESSLPLRDVARAASDEVAQEEADEDDHPVGKLRRPPSTPLPFDRDPVLQSALPFASMPAAIQNFLSQGNTNDAPTLGGTPPDTNGAVGPNHFVQTVNTGLAIWDKTGKVVLASKNTNTLWTGYVGTNAGNGCATNNDGDPVVVYDQLADRWFISQFSLPNANSGPNFQCIAVSKTADPTGAYWLYDFSYPGLNDYGKFGIWPDAYFATFNMFVGNNADSDLCAYDRVSMLNGHTATQQCFQQSGGTVYGALPVSLDGKIPPPRGEPGYFMQLSSSNNSSLDLFKINLDWTTPASSTLTGPTNIPVVAFAQMCSAAPNGNCVPQKSPGNALDSLGDRLMFRLTYRNFGTHEALMVNHSVDVGTTGGVRWYEIRSPNATPVVYQQGTYAPTDGNFRWMASLAQDQAEDFVLGFSISSSTTFPSIGWTGRLAGDALNTMAEGESIIDNGSGVETGNFKNGQLATRWGDYSNLTVDPVDDCTFWYTQELYHVTGPTPRTWDTEVASVKFPSCALNDFSLAVSPGAKSVAAGSKVTYTVTTPGVKGSAETIVLTVQDLPNGLSGAFSPASVPAGTSSTLTVSASASAAVTASPVTFMVIGKAPSAVHAATAEVTVVAGNLVDAGTDSGSTGNDAGIGGTDSGASADSAIAPDSAAATDSAVAGDSAAASDSAAAVDSAPANDSAVADDSAAAGDTAAPPITLDGASDLDATGPTPGSDDSGADGSSGSGGTGSSGGCGCRTVPARGTSPLGLAIGGLVTLGAIRRRRRARR